MQYEVNFGRLDTRNRPAPGPVFRVALLGDFSGRAAAGALETGEALGRRKPLKADVDTLDDLIARLLPRLAIALDGETAVTVPLATLDDFHPDQLAENLPLFEQLLDLRRTLQSRSGFDRAAKEVLSWAGAELLPPSSRRARGAAIATDRKLSDLARLTGRKPRGEAMAGDLIRRIVGPHIVPEQDKRQDVLIARVDAALSDAMRRLLHHPDYQAAEALWRGLEFLVRRAETGARLQIVLYDISAEELAADLAASDQLAQSALYSLLVEQPKLDAHQGPLSLIAGLYQFEVTPPHAELLGRMAQLAAAAGTPFIASVGPGTFRTPEHDWHPLVRQAWRELRALPASVYLGLATPRFLLRLPYGKKTDPIDAFAFEEFTPESGLRGMLWGNPAILLAHLIVQGWLQGGKAAKPGAVATVGELPVYVYYDTDGEQIALPCTERLFTERNAIQVAAAGVIPMLSLRGRPEIRAGGFGSLAGAPLAGPWAPVEVKPPPGKPAPPPPAPTSAPKPAAAGAPAPAEAAASPAPEESPPEEPAPAEPAPQEPAPQEPAPQEPAPQEPAPQEPAPQEPAPQEPPPQGPEPSAAPAAGSAGLADEPSESADELDALLASLNVEPPPAPPDEVDADLDALLASLK